MALQSPNPVRPPTPFKAVAAGVGIAAIVAIAIGMLISWWLLLIFAAVVTAIAWVVVQASRNSHAPRSMDSTRQPALVAAVPRTSRTWKKFTVFAGVALLGLWIWNDWSRSQRTPRSAVNFAPQHWGCGAQRSDLDLFEAPDKLITPYYPAEGCFAKLVLPGHSHHWHLQTAGAKQPGDWLAIACPDGRVVVPPQDPDSGARFECNYNDGREQNTFLFQGHVASGITFVTQ